MFDTTMCVYYSTKLCYFAHSKSYICIKKVESNHVIVNHPILNFSS